jgi:hypothetical protein
MPKGGYKIIKGRFKKQTIIQGYPYIIASINGEKKQLSVHRLVAKAFPEICGKWFEGCQVDHIDTIRTNNNAYNLKVCTAKENQNNPLTKKHMSQSQIGKKQPYSFSVKMRNIMSGRKLSKLTRQKMSKAHLKRIKENSVIIVQYDIFTKNKLNTYFSSREAERQTGISHNSILKCCNNIFKQAGGFIWKYENNKEMINK